jgi:nucleoid-associated protein YgaU
MRIKLKTVFFSVALFGIFQVLSACSGSQEQQEELIQAEGEEVPAEGAEGQEAAAEGQEAAAGEEAQGDYAGEEGYENNYGNEGGEEEATASENVEGEAAEGEAVEGEEVAADDAVEQQGDLQEIIEEMNQDGAASADAAAGNEAMAEGTDADAVLASDEAAPATPGAGTENIAVGGGAEAAAPAPAASMAAPAAGQGVPEMNSKMSYVVQKGDSLAGIARKVYGDMSKWKEIAEMTGLENPKLIYPGDVVYYRLTDASMAFASAYEGAARAEVTVQQGDTLSTIAGRVLGDSSSWKIIWRENDNIDNPDQLVVGSTVYYVAPGSSASVEGAKGVQVAKTVKGVKSQTVKAEFSKVVGKTTAGITSVDAPHFANFV